MKTQTRKIELPGSLQQELRSCRSLPSIPAVVVQILDLCETDDVSIPQIAQVLARDPALAAKLLKVANSAYYGVRSQVTTVERAISILGINATMSLALSFSFVSDLRRIGAGGFDHSAYWKRSVVTAASARTISKQVAAVNTDEAFLSGLLQDIGMLALNEAMPGRYGSLIGEADGDHQRLVELERMKLGADHAAVGAWLLDSWHLPENLRISVAVSHNPVLLDSFENQNVCRTAILAGQVAGIWSDPDVGAAAAVARETAIELLDISPEKFEILLSDIAARLPEITSHLEVDIGGEEKVGRLLDQAREALVVLNLQAQRQVRIMEDRAHRDGLTSLYNRSYLEDLLPEYFEISSQMSQPLSVVFLDIDHFKKVNDTYGHQAGDAVLISIARIIRSALRGSDIVARYGGEEFVCLLSNTGEEGARLLGERLRSAVASQPHQIANNAAIDVTISAGCATHGPERRFKSAMHLLKEADRCLYDAKRSGRNRVVVSGSLPGRQYPSSDTSGTETIQ